jgi:hypothetical protein
LRTRRELLVLHNLERFAMYSDPIPQTTLQAGDALSPLHLKPLTKEMTMDRHYGRTKNFWARVALSAAAFAMSATLLLAVFGAFYSVSSEPVLADSLEARSAVAGCDALGDRIARQHCARRLVAGAKARDAGEAQFAASAAHQRVVRR